MKNKIFNIEASTGMKDLPDNYITLTVTSPPYDDLRNYSGKETDKWDFEKFKKIAQQLYIKTKEGGTVVWVVGDAVINKSETGSSFKQALYFLELGFTLEDTYIYEKNGSSFPARRDGNRYSQLFEYMFILKKGVSKDKKNFSNKKNVFPKQLFIDHNTTWCELGRVQNIFAKTFNNKYEIKNVKSNSDLIIIESDSEYNPIEKISEDKELIFNKLKKGGIFVWVANNDIPHEKLYKEVLEFKELGFKLHDTMIYDDKENRFSFMFILSKKDKPLYSKLICDKPNKWAGHTSFGKCKMRGKDGELKERKMKPVPDFSPRNNIWRYDGEDNLNKTNIFRYLTGKNYSTKDNEAFKHPAIFPEELVKDMICIFSEKNDIINDPFMGSGTTAKISYLNERFFIGYEIFEEYIHIIKNRLKKYGLNME